jgi:hypothetical protein
MGTYSTTKCGHCNYAWEIMEYGSKGSIGPPVIKCRNCLGMNKNPQVLYREADWYTKLVFWLRVSLNALVFGLGGIAAGIGFYLNLDSNLKWFGVFPFLFGIFIVFQTSQNKKAINILEKTFDNNGGFVWSDESF